jgi:propionyl-CoA carboxylase alpha chain
MIAKLITYGSTRQAAIDTMLDALGKFVIRGVSHNISFLQAVFSNQRFISGDICTSFIEQEYKDGFFGAELTDEDSAVVLASTIYIALTDSKRDSQITGQIRGFSRYAGTRWVVKLDDKNYPVTVRPIEDGYKVTFERRRLYISSKWLLGNKLFDCIINGKSYSLQVEYASGAYNLSYVGRTVKTSVHTPRAAELSKFIKKRNDANEQKDVVANISGLVVDVKVEEGDSVSKGQPVLILEAMKMENILYAPNDGKIVKIHTKKGASVSNGETLIEIE